MQSNVAHTFEFNLNYTNMLMAEVPDERMAEQPTGITNHGAWNLGHIIYSLSMVRQLTGAGPDANPLPEGEYGMGSAPTNDRAAYPSKEDLLAKLAATHDALAPRLAAMKPEDLAAVNPNEGFRKMMPTVGDAITFLSTSHYAVHLGELAVWRKAIGLPQLF